MFRYNIILILCILVFVQQIQANIILNEVYPAPINGEFEWVEIYNTSSDSILLKDYYLLDASGKKIFFLQETLNGNSYTTATSSSVLNNTDETISLLNGENKILDSIRYTLSFDSSRSYSRCETTWISTTQISKNASNSLACLPTPQPMPSSLPSAVPSPIITPLSDDEDITIENISISEFYPYPGSGEKEWVEIYNNNPFKVTLTDWYLDDAKDSGSKPFKFTTEIEAFSYKQIILNTSLLNNTSDSIRLLNPNLVEIESLNYTSAKKNLSIAKNKDGLLCIQTPTPEKLNQGCHQDSSETSKSASIAKIPTTTTFLSQNSLQTKSSALRNQSKTISNYISYPLFYGVNGSNFIFTQIPSGPPLYILYIVRFVLLCTIIINFTIITLVILKSRKYTGL